MFRFQTPTVIWQQDGTWTSVVAPLLHKFCPIHLFVRYLCLKHLEFFILPPGHTGRRSIMFSICPSIRPSVRPSRLSTRVFVRFTKLVNAIFWKQMNQFWYQLAQVVYGEGMKWSTRKTTRPKGQEWCLRQAFKSNFGLLWPWSLTFWPSRLTVSCPGTACSQIWYRTSGRTDGRTDGRTNGQVEKPENITPVASLVWQRHKNPFRRDILRELFNEFQPNLIIIIIIIIIIFISSAALSKIRRAAGTCHSVLTKRCAFRRRAKVAVDSVDRRSSADKLFQVSG